MEKDSPLSTNRLFHYTSEQKYLIDILRNGFQSRFSLEKLDVLKGYKSRVLTSEVLSDDSPTRNNLTDEFAIAMTCFCDIPLDLVSNHVKLYGEYAIGLKKEWGETVGICPVFYIPEHGETRALFELLIEGYYKDYEKLMQLERVENIKPSCEEHRLIVSVMNFYTNLHDLLFYIKPYIGDYERKGIVLKDHKFYDEREWRYIPSNMLCKPYMSKEEFLEYKNGILDVELVRLSFEPSFITDILVPEGEVDVVRRLISSIPGMKEFDLSLVKSMPYISSF